MTQTRNCRHHGFAVRHSTRTGITRGDFVDYPLSGAYGTGIIAVHPDGTIDYSNFTAWRGTMRTMNSGTEPWVVKARQEALEMIRSHSKNMV